MRRGIGLNFISKLLCTSITAKDSDIVLRPENFKGLMDRCEL